MSQVLVLDTEWKPCTPVPPGRARHLLTAKRAALFRRSPVTLIHKAGERCEGVQSLRLKIDPGSTATGRQSRQMCRTDAFGFPDNAATATSVVGGLRTGDMVRAMVPVSRVKAGA